jgi:NADPH2:quinone reductase
VKAARIHEHGGPEVIRYEDAPKPAPAPGEVLLKVAAAGFNTADGGDRSGR